MGRGAQCYGPAANLCVVQYETGGVDGRLCSVEPITAHCQLAASASSPVSHPPPFVWALPALQAQPQQPLRGEQRHWAPSGGSQGQQTSISDGTRGKWWRLWAQQLRPIMTLGSNPLLWWWARRIFLHYSRLLNAQKLNAKLSSNISNLVWGCFVWLIFWVGLQAIHPVW